MAFSHETTTVHGIVGVLKRLLEVKENPAIWSLCGACGCLISDRDEEGCPLCRATLLGFTPIG